MTFHRAFHVMAVLHAGFISELTSAIRLQNESNHTVGLHALNKSVANKTATAGDKSKKTNRTEHVGTEKAGRNNAKSMERAAAKKREFQKLVNKFAEKNDVVYPYDLMTCASDVVLTTTFMREDTYDAIVADVQRLIDSIDSSCVSSSCPQAEFSGCLLRLAGHDFMDYKDGKGGSDGCLDLDDTDNTGLRTCLYEGEFGVSLQDAYTNWCSSVSLADFFVVAAEAVMSWSRNLVIAQDSDAATVDFKSNFKYGRTTSTSCSFAAGRLPNPENGCSDNEAVFITNMGLSWEDTTALMGVHTLGNAKAENSGYKGWWSDATNSRKFNNNYYVSMIMKGWVPEKSVGGNSAKNQWQRGDMGVTDSSDDSHELMLNTDLCLAFVCASDSTTCNGDSTTVVVSQDYLKAQDLDCCTWVFFADGWFSDVQAESGVSYCGYDNSNGDYDDTYSANEEQTLCCNGDHSLGTERTTFLANKIDNCQTPACATYVEADNSINYVQKFASKESTWLGSFIVAWVKATGNNFDSLSELDAF